MTEIKLVFSKSDSIWSKIIRFATFSKWSHVEYITPDGNFISAEIGKGVYVEHEDRNPTWTKYEIVTVECSDLQAEQFFKWINKQVGKKYDFVGIFGLWFGRRWQDEDSWFCSELIVAGLVKFKIVETAGQPHRITPQMMYDGLKGR
jgi:uncharacterized protein YycO